jgi:tRNA(fMet)-specific endonuclease VapC
MKYMLDTNICIYIINNKPKTVLDRFLALDSSDTVYISAISVAELFYGLEKSSSPKKEQNKLALIKFLSPLEIVSYSEKAAIEYGIIRAKLEKSGQPIGANDMLIASHAKSMDCTVVTNNTKEFERVNGLKIQNWV